jgi:isoleucyl-tRNA synthetase
MSNLYLDIIKDRLYCERAGSAKRRSGQTAIYLILDAMVRLIAPILAFTSNEIWQAMPHHDGANPEHIMLNDIVMPNPAWKITDEAAAYWDKLFKLRADVNKALELARGEKIIGKPLDAEITIFADDSAYDELSGIAAEKLAEICIVSKVTVKKGAGDGYSGVEYPGITVSVVPSTAPKCVRCWTHNEHIGENHEHPELCPRCAAAVSD